jgi:hypothetical protein
MTKSGKDIYMLSCEIIEAMSKYEPIGPLEKKEDLCMKSLAFTLARILNLFQINNEEFMKAFSLDVIGVVPIAKKFDGPILEQIMKEKNVH